MIECKSIWSDAIKHLTRNIDNTERYGDSSTRKRIVETLNCICHRTNSIHTVSILYVLYYVWARENVRVKKLTQKCLCICLLKDMERLHFKYVLFHLALNNIFFWTYLYNIFVHASEIHNTSILCMMVWILTIQIYAHKHAHTTTRAYYLSSSVTSKSVKTYRCITAHTTSP